MLTGLSDQRSERRRLLAGATAGVSVGPAVVRSGINNFGPSRGDETQLAPKRRRMKSPGSGSPGLGFLGNLDLEISHISQLFGLFDRGFPCIPSECDAADRIAGVDVERHLNS